MKFFFWTDGRVHLGTHKYVQTICQELDFPCGRFTEGGFVFHDLRHSFTTILHRRLIDNRTTTEFTDNPYAIGDYQHATEESKKKAMELIQSRFGNGSPIECELRAIFEQVRAGTMTFEEFNDSVNSRGLK